MRVFKLPMAAVSLDCNLVFIKLGMAMAEMMAIIATTIINSIKVKPFLFFMFALSVGFELIHDELLQVVDHLRKYCRLSFLLHLQYKKALFEDLEGCVLQSLVTKNCELSKIV